MNKGKKKMKRNKEKKLKVKGPEAIEDGLMEMGRAIEAGGPWTHPEMERIPEWRGADIRITSDFKTDFNDPNYFDHDLTVRTRHAGAGDVVCLPDAGFGPLCSGALSRCGEGGLCGGGLGTSELEGLPFSGRGTGATGKTGYRPLAIRWLCGQGTDT